MKYLLLILSILIITSCKTYPSEVMSSLEKAGDNRRNLESVLKKYRLNPRKYKAACFLISNMKYHKSNVLLSVDSGYRDFIYELNDAHDLLSHTESLYDIDSLQENISDKFSSLKITKKQYYISDLQTISADFLIDNIETAFSIYRNCTRFFDLSFDDFLRFILPYRCSDESLILKRSEILSFAEKIGISNKNLYTKDIIQEYNNSIKSLRILTNHISNPPHLGLLDLYLPKFKNDCQNIGAWTTDVLRAIGLPTVYEYTPQWEDKSKRHFWCSSIDTNGVFYPYTPPDNNLLDDWESNLRYASKVYRKTFEANYSTPYFMKGCNEGIPDEFNNPLLSDQTFRYHQTLSLSMPFEYNTRNNLCYLCLFDKDCGINAVGWGVIDKRTKTVKFEHVPLNIIFFPAIYIGEQYVPVGPPFMINSENNLKWLPSPHTIANKQAYISPIVYVKNNDQNVYSELDIPLKDVSIKQYSASSDTHDMIVYRKYPDKRNLRKYREEMVGTIICGGNHLHEPFDTLYSLNFIPDPYLKEYLFKNKNRYRYYLVESEKRKRLNIAHLELLGPYSKYHQCVTPTELPDFGLNDGKSKTSFYNIKGDLIWTGNSTPNAFDDDKLTYVSASRLLLDYTEPVIIEGVALLPRNADNMITKGDSYSLMYYDLGWVEHSTFVATANFITFKDVPLGCVYWLRNNSNGREELPFLYNGFQQFINDI